MSGGVDSSVSAALLVEQGFDVTGVFIKAWHPEWAPCDWKDDRRDAMRVCAKLDIPFVTLDLEKEYKQEVVDCMVREYSAGRTPNPDVMCNKYVKFGGFLKYALSKGAEYVATGHYAQRTTVGKNIERGVRNDEKATIQFTLSTSRDTEKDQTYFLWTLNQDQLKHIIFPIGHLKKDEVRKLAKKFDLPNASKKDSQGLCFVGKVDMKEFLEHFITPKKGKVLDSEGNTIGMHDGALFLTIGQRHGFTVRNQKAGVTPLYVVEKNITKNTVTVSTKDPNSISEYGVQSIELSQVNWINSDPEVKTVYSVRLRYRQTLVAAQIVYIQKKWTVNLQEKILGASVGQSLVVYIGTACIGGGVIERVF